MHPIMMPDHLGLMVRQFFNDSFPNPVQNIIVLIVLALGKVFQHRETMRDNNDSIPGLEYMAAASQFMDEHHERDTVEHAQIFILTALYYDQLGRVVESYSYLEEADRALRMIMDCDSGRFKEVQGKTAFENMTPEDQAKNGVLLIYWTCLMLAR
ncbi:hypothetical protein ColTof4_01325 [Colletotrichum tofieldiae]|nr:hypothetical protein ColTof3_08577 [Colletotrichum tofieldiae]GKT68902.1 hypothetical protein ColTof4_01325 [Colletotrichum tofieldiae]